ncbi:MAG: hypothetical protein GXP16_06085, partial [Gammaproteobacteria bacterium]|nr:hypothetical protein [Gammaproteobacteria bacterium]
PPADPFGLTMRAPLANLNLPFSAGGGLGTYQVVNAFPNLNFSAALFLAGVPQENRLVVVQQSGFIRAFENASSTTISRTILDLSGRISFGGEEGLLGFAFDPAFAQNRYVYVHYSMNPPRRSVISRFTWDQGQDAIIVGSEKIILEVSQPETNHNGGMLAFGPDDFLYIAFGDGGFSGDPDNNSQNTTNLLGSMLRLDVHPQNPTDAYDIPADNPFVAANDGVEDEIWAYGLRNPFRFSFDRQNGDLWLGDVGQLAFEEIDIITRGGNYGWRVYEGNADFDGSANSLPRSAFTFPVFEYGRNEGVAVIGGYVYRGTDISSLQGRYLYSDFISGTIWAITYNGSTVVSNDRLTSANRPTSFGEDNQGEVYVVTQGGSIFNIEETTPGGGNLPVLLSQTGVFTSLANLTPASGLIEYDVTMPFWSDGTIKRRWLAIPDGQEITFSNTNSWQFPQGTVLVKHFELLLTEGDTNSARRLETRLLIRTSSGWEGYTYRWNSNETDATLLTGRESETITVNLAGGGTRDQQYDYPSRPDCLSCHNQIAGFALSAKTRQLNRDFVYPNATDNQLRSLNNIDLFSTDIGSATNYQSFPALDDTAVNMEQRARAYLDVNCAQCHQPGGGTPVSIDLRIDIAANAMSAISVSPQAGDLGLANAAIIRPGSKEQSTLWERLRRTD